MKSKIKKELLEVKIFWLPISEEIFYQGKALAVSSQNKLGKFDILVNHSNFVTLIFDSLSIILPEEEGTVREFFFEKGVLEVTKNKVNIFLGF